MLLALGVSTIEAPSFHQIIGKRISHVWFGDYSSLYIEVGNLSPGKQLKNGKPGNPVGEISIYLGFSWLLQEGGVVAGGSKSSSQKYAALAHALLNQSILNVELSPGSNLLKLDLSNQLAVLTSELNATDPDWSVTFNSPSLGHIFIKEGSLHADKDS